MAANNNPVNPKENRLVFSSNPGSLKELACVVTSASFYCRQLNQSDIASLPLPAIFRQMTEKCILVVENSLKKWTNFHNSLIFSHRKDENIAIVFEDFMAWRADGTINFEQTAVNLIKCDLLSQMEKYRLACIYCMVDDVRKLWRIETAANHPMVRYWNSRMSGTPYKIPVEPGCSCIEASLLKDNYSGTRSAFEYLWGFMTDDEQVQKVKNIGNWTKGKWLLKCALLKLNESQLQRVISNSNHVFYVLYSEARALVVPLWDHVKNMITPEAFNALIFQFLIFASRKVPSLAYEIWIRAPEMLKNHVLVNNFQHLLNSSTKDERLFLDLLLTTDVETRESIWREKWRDIIVNVSLSYLQKIMELCLGNGDEIASFKRTHLSNYALIENSCQAMVLRGYFDEMSYFFRFASDDSEIIFNLKKNVLTSQYFRDACIKFPRVKDMNSLVTFLRNTFSDTSERQEFERNLILSDESLTYFRLVMLSDVNLIVGVKNFVCSILSSDADLASAKIMLLQLNYEILISGDFVIDSRSNSSSRNDFIKWCLDDDDDALDNFKRSLPVTVIFYTMFEKCALELKQSMDRNVIITGERASFSSFRVKLIFSNLTWFLEWVFPTKNAVLDFKRDKLWSYFNVEQMRSIFEIDDQAFIDHLLCWLLNDDRSRIHIFKIFYSRVRFRKRLYYQNITKKAR
ncbi:uncharacterized protein LOC135845409 isoform X1 [Planococcus citri]|uniref:uncharacterized protein LOC135845409 isoform X1 n=1 Tax=Planococcus citri TaxID=170843 RepID=UPI0031F98206